MLTNTRRWELIFAILLIASLACSLGTYGGNDTYETTAVALTSAAQDSIFAQAKAALETAQASKFNALRNPTVTPSLVPASPTPTPSPTHKPLPTATPTPYPPLPTLAPEFWATVGSPRYTRIAIQTGNGFSPFSDIAVRSIGDTHLIQITNYGFNADPALSPDGQLIAYRSIPKSIAALGNRDSRLYAGYYNIWLITIDGNQAWQLTASEMRRSKPMWSSDSRRLTFSEGEGSESILVEVQADSRLRREIIRGASAPRFRPDGNGIGYITARGGLAWIDASDTIHLLIPADTLPISTTVDDFEWLPDGQHIVYTLANNSNPNVPFGKRYSVWIARTDGTEQLKLIGPSTSNLSNLKASPDGQTISAISSSYGDACFAGSAAVFLLLAPDYQSTQIVGVASFEGGPTQGIDLYPVSDINWISSRLAFANFGITCNPDQSKAGMYLIDLATRHLTQIGRP
jgi:Tol biopolymer transport system component